MVRRNIYMRLMMGLLACALSFGILAAENPANPLITDRGMFRPLILITPSLDNADYQRIREQLQAQRDDFEQRQMVLYSIEAGNGHRAGRPMTPHETHAVLEAMNVSPDGPLTVILVGMDGGKKMQLEGFVPPRQVFDIIDNMPIRTGPDEEPPEAERP